MGTNGRSRFSRCALLALAAAGLAGVTTVAAAVPAGAETTRTTGVTATTATTTATATDATVPGVTSLSGVACPSAVECVAVGVSKGTFGRSVAIDAATGAARVGAGSLTDRPFDAVACAADAKTCVAVAGNDVAAVNASTGALTLTAVVKLTPALVVLDAVSCASASACYAIGTSRTPGVAGSEKAVVTELTGDAKLVRTVDDPVTGIGNIVCPTATRCLLSVVVSGAVHIQVMTDGKLGASTPLASGTYVQAISCDGTALCEGVAGNDDTKSSTASAPDEILPLNPTTGAPGRADAIGGGFSGYSIACASATRCVVAGSVGEGAAAKPAVVVVTDGKPGAPVPVAGTEGLSHIACASATVCYAVGSGTGSVGVVDRIIL